MDSLAEEKRTGKEVSSTFGTKEAEQTDNKKHNGSFKESEANGPEQQLQEDEEMESADGGDLSSINSMMSTVMKAAQLNGGVEGNKTSAKSSSKSPSTGRYARKNQEAKNDSSSLTCPLCDKSCQNQHQLTMHIRQHNSDTGTADHSCSICGKCLSSASSLDRHMLVHSGERPYKCSICSQTFTTNGNMHRHMKIHDKDAATTIPTSPPSSPVKRRRSSTGITKRKLSHTDDQEVDEPSSKKVVEDAVEEQAPSKGQDEQLPCPICFKIFTSKSELDTHMEAHPDTALRCDLCCMTFRTHRSLVRHNAVTHKQLPTDSNGRPFIQNNPSIALGFNDLAFIDMSCRKFPQIAQLWCETNLRRCTSKLHRFVCETCDKAFPLRSALDLHKSTHEGSDSGPESTPSQLSTEEHRMPEKKSFMGTLGLQHASEVKAIPTELDAMQADLDSIRVIHVDPSTTTDAGFVGGTGLSLVDPTSLRGLTQHEALKLLSLQPFQTGFLVQPDGGLVVKPVCGETGTELADIQQILKVASAAPSQISLPPLSKAPCSAMPSGNRQMPPLKPKPLVAPRTTMTTSTPPPLLNTQQASLGCISPSLPPPAGHSLKAAKELSPSTSSSSSTCNQASIEKMQMEAECMGDAHTPMDTEEQQIKLTEDKMGEMSGKKGVGRKGSYPCRYCDQIFPLSGILQAHMRQHLGILPYQCNICDYVAPDKATLIRHLRTHSGERPYVCRVCHYPFTVKANCERHLRKKHMKNGRKEIEKNIKYVASFTSVPEQAGSGDTVCSICGEDLKNFRALQVHMRIHNGFQQKPYECKCCGATFLAKRNCIHHLLKQHPGVKEQDIDEHISILTFAPSNTNPNPSPVNGVSPSASLTSGLTSVVRGYPIKVEDLSVYGADPDQPLDFSNKKRSANNTESTTTAPVIKMEPITYDSSMEPIDLSIPKNPGKKMKLNADADLLREIKKEQPTINTFDQITAQGLQFEEKPHYGCYQLPLTLASLGGPNANSRALRLKPLLPKPISGMKELPPLASITQIISQVCGAPDLLKRENPNCYPPDSEVSSKQDFSSSLPEVKLHDGPRRRSNKKASMNPIKEKPAMNSVDSNIDLESSGEFASVEKMLATTNTNKFSTYLQTNTIEHGKKDHVWKGDRMDIKDEKISKQISQHQQSKVKKNAYSNSVQKMTCPFCPRVFPWASSLQRHMLTHTGQKPYPCPQCEALFSTKSNCERHLLRKHGITSRILRQNGAIPQTKQPEDGSPGSAESMSDTEFSMGEVMELVNSVSEKPTASDAEKPSPAKPTEAAAVKPLFQSAEQEQQNEHEPVSEDDSHSNKSLDLNFATKLIDLNFEIEQPKSCPAVDNELQELTQDESKLTCKSCSKSFRFAATLARHEKVHQLESAADAPSSDLKVDGAAESPGLNNGEADEEKEGTELQGTTESEEAGSTMDTCSDEENEDRSDEEGAATEPQNCEGEAPVSGGKTDKRKKICDVCSKRFWSLQDLTRHMRSHTGERPYKCQTCERTFTLKHSLVRHQRIHQKPRGTDEDMTRGGEEDGFSGRSASEGESTPTNANTSSENESDEKKNEQKPSPRFTTTEVMERTKREGRRKQKKDPRAAKEKPKEQPPHEPDSNSPRRTEVGKPEGFLHGLLEIHTKQDLELILPNEPPLLGVE